MLVDPYAWDASLFTNEALGFCNLWVRSRWHRIVTLSAPRVATPQTAEAEPAAAHDSVSLHCLEKVARAGRFKATASARSAEEREHRRDGPLIRADQNSDDQEHQGARIEVRLARRNHSSSSARYCACAAGWRAITTSQTSGCSSCWWSRTISRKRLRTRFRLTALPTRFEVTIPTRNGPVSASVARRTPKTMKVPRSVCPSRLTRRNSAGRVRRLALPKRKQRGGVSLLTLPL